MIIDNEICTIDISRGGLDNIYTFFESGKIRNSYDQNNYKLNQERWIEVNEISDNEKVKLLKNCLDKYRNRITEILYKGTS